MPSPLVSITTPADLVARAPAWNDLWRRSRIDSPGRRAEMIALWAEQFAPDAAFHTLAVEQEGRLVAGLPLVGRKLGNVLPVGGLPTGAWCACGDLLLDDQVEAKPILRQLLQGMADLPWPALWLDGVALDTERWIDLQQVAEEAGMAVYAEPKFEIGWLPIEHDWNAYERSLSKNHRRNMKRAVRSLRAQGDLTLHMPSLKSPEEVDRWVTVGLELEHRGWKGKAGSSVLATSGMRDFFRRQSRLLASWNELEVVFLELDDRPIAFELAWTAKGVYHSFKVAYDEAFAPQSPGQVLMYLLLEQFHSDPTRRAIDCMGPMSDAVARWRPTTYRLARMVIAPRNLLGRGLLEAYRAWNRMHRKYL